MKSSELPIGTYTVCELGSMNIIFKKIEIGKRESMCKKYNFPSSIIYPLKEIVVFQMFERGKTKYVYMDPDKDIDQWERVIDECEATVYILEGMGE